MKSPPRGGQCLVFAGTLLVALASLAPTARAEQRYVRYRLTAPAVDSVASASIMPHAEGPGITISSEPVALPGVISQHGLYVQSGLWSDWYRLPAPPVWGTVYLKLRAADPLPGVTTDVQVATFPDEKSVVRTLHVASTTGSSVGFVVPANVLATPEQVESIEETMQRRRRVAQSVAVPESRRPRLLSFSPAGVRDDPTVADAQRREFETAALLGFNTADVADAGADGIGQFRTRSTYETGTSPEKDRARLAPYLAARGTRPPLRYSMMVDEPGYKRGFDAMWAAGGVKGFHDFLREQNVDPARSGTTRSNGCRTSPAPSRSRRTRRWRGGGCGTGPAATPTT